MRLPLLPLLCTLLCMAALLFKPVDGAVDHLSVPLRIRAGQRFTVTFHTKVSPTGSKQWMALVGVYLGQPHDSSLGAIVGTVYLDQSKLSLTGNGAFQRTFVAPKWSVATLGKSGRQVTITAQYLESYGQTNRGDIRSQAITAILMP